MREQDEVRLSQCVSGYDRGIDLGSQRGCQTQDMLVEPWGASDLSHRVVLKVR